MMIFKEKNGVLGPRVKANLRIPTNVVVAASPNGWMTRSKLWGNSLYGSRRLQVLYSYRPHKSTDTQEKAEALNTDIIIIPG